MKRFQSPGIPVALQLVPERGQAGRVALEPPVLVVDPVVLGLVEPHETEQVVGPDAGEQVGDLRRLPGHLPDADLGEEYRPLREYPYFGDGRQEGAVERVRAQVVISV